MTDFKLGEDRLQLSGIVNGAGDTLQDLLDAGLNAASSGTTLSIFQGDRVVIEMTGWKGPQITSMQESWTLCWAPASRYPDGVGRWRPRAAAIAPLYFFWQARQSGRDAFGAHARRCVIGVTRMRVKSPASA